MKKIILVLYLLVNSIFAENHSAEWEIAKSEMATEAYSSAIKMFQGDTCKATAWSNCVSQERAKYGIQGNCKYFIEAGDSRQNHLVKQVNCFNAVGYDSEKRKSIGAQCQKLASRVCK